MKFRVSNDVDGIAFVVCTAASAPTYFTDNVRGVCAFCGCAVQHRPHIPQPSTLVCWECYQKTASDDDDVLVTPRTVAEVLGVLGAEADDDDQ